MKREDETKVLDATVRLVNLDTTDLIEAKTVAFSHVEMKGRVVSCLVAVTKENGIWIYLSRQLYTSIQHEVYARLNNVEYEEYLEMQDYSDARYPEPNSEDLKAFFSQFKAEFMPLRSITDYTIPNAAAFTTNAEPVGHVYICSPLSL